MNLQHQTHQNKMPATAAVASMIGHDDSLPTDCLAAIERFPHLLQKVCELWQSRDLEVFINAILMDSRDGQRQGLPVEVATELMFIAKLNTQVRSLDTAHLLDISVAEAKHLVANADSHAIGPASHDLWNEAPTREERSRSQRKTNAPSPTAPVARPILPAAEKPKAVARQGGGNSTERYLSLFLNDTPPIPALVRIELTSPETARTAHFPNEAMPAMSWDFFRCITQEIKSQGVDELILAHHGEADKCPWLAEAVRQTKERCHFHQVSLSFDILSTTEQQLDGAIAAGLDCLIIDLNVSSKTWIKRAEARLAQNPTYFLHTISHLLQKCDENRSRALHRCLIKVRQVGKIAPEHKLASVIAQVAEQAHAFSIEWLPDLHDLMEGSAGGRPTGTCLCWTPFIEANIRPNGHMMVCPHDSLGSSYVADLKQTEFTSAWHAEKFRKTRHGLLAGHVAGTLCAACPRMTRQSHSS